jgi:membrane fusion protein, multidrug efflux system
LPSASRDRHRRRTDLAQPCKRQQSVSTGPGPRSPRRLAAALLSLLLIGGLAVPGAPVSAQTTTRPPVKGSVPAAPASPAPAAPAAVAPAPPAPAPAAVADSGIRVLLIPQRETTVVSQIVGQISKLGGELGASVAQGAPLVMLDCTELQARLRMSDAELDSARQQHEAKLRLQGLNAAGEVEVSMAAAAVEKARAQIELSKAQLRQCVIAAPFAGRIVKLHVKQYQGVNIGQPLVDLVSGGPLKVKLNAPSKWLAWLKAGTKFEVHIDETGKSYPAVVSAINGRVDAVSQSVELEGRVSGSYAELLAGMSGNARFAQAQ